MVAMPHADDAQVGDHVEWVAEEAVVDGGEEGGDDEDGDARIVKLPHEHGDVLGAAAKQVANGGGEEADHGANGEYVDGPAVDRPGDVDERG